MKLGTWGEERALEYLLARGYTLLARNARAGACELDLVMEYAGMVVFVEVKTRTYPALAAPEEALSARKQERLQRAAWGFLEQQDRLHSPWRIDVIAIEVSRGREILRFDHYPAAFDVGLA